MLAVVCFALAASAVTTYPVSAQYDGSSLAINEIMILPLSSSSTEAGQWIELYNSGENWINLTEWSLENEKGQTISFRTLLVPPGGYFVIGASSITTENGNYSPDAVWTSFFLSASGSLSLINQDSDSAESVSWNSTWDILPGSSLERVNPGWAADDSHSWQHSTENYGDGDYGTPGARNSAFSNGFGQNSWAFIKAFVH